MRHLVLALLLLALASCAPTPPEQPTTLRIAFGSCAWQDEPQPLLDVAVGLRPDAFVYLGDNIYGDTYVMDTLRAKYGRLAARPEFQRLKAATPLFATWDDHDYGWNDIGRHYPFKDSSKAIFLDFWEVPEGDERYDRPGIYGVEYVERDERVVQVILLDTRTFRDDLIRREKADSVVHKNDYVPNTNPDSTFLGAAQWAWLGKQLRVPADARIIASSNQFGHSYNGWESWTNVPHERQRMLDLLASTSVENAVFISGDVHWGEISALPLASGDTLYDVTSSGITSEWYNIEPNQNRVGAAVAQNNVGFLEFQFLDGGSSVRIGLVDSSGVAVVETTVDL